MRLIFYQVLEEGAVKKNIDLQVGHFPSGQFIPYSG
jgi:hypothetical protein